MNVTFFQTADPDRYRDLLLSTSRTVARYVRPRGYAQEVFLGIKRGCWPWQASFNRIYIFEELIARGWSDWAVYMDADAFIADLDFDLDAYLADKGDRAAVMTPSNATQHWWDVNNGVLMFNLRHPLAHRLVARWKAMFETRLPDAVLPTLSGWSNPNDQEMLQEILVDDPQIAAAIHFETPLLFNSLEGRFIRQILREAIPDFPERTRVICAHVEAVLQVRDPLALHDQAEREQEKITAVVTQVYESLLRRPPDGQGMIYYGRMIELLGAEAGSRKMALELMQSQEYQMLTSRDANLAVGG